MYPAEDREDLEAQIEVTRDLVKHAALLSRSRNARVKLAASSRQVQLEKDLMLLEAELKKRIENPEFALAAETAGSQV
jgi:hypothetical protein